MSNRADRAAKRIAARGREALLDQLRPAFERQAAARADVVKLDRDRLEQLVSDAADRADGALWRRALATVATDELGIGFAQAVRHPAVERAQALVGAPPYRPSPAPATEPPGPQATEPPGPQATEPSGPQALRLRAVHLGGIETVRTGDRDIELRFSDAGLDVLKRSSGVAIGRLAWPEIATIDLPQARRGLRSGRRRVQELHVTTGRGAARFELPDLTEVQLREHLEPMLARSRGPGQVTQTG